MSKFKSFLAVACCGFAIVFMILAGKVEGQESINLSDANRPGDFVAPTVFQAAGPNIASIQGVVTEFRNAWTDVKLSNVEMWAAGDYVVQTFKFEAKHEKDLGKIKKTGKTVSLDAAEVMHFKDGKIDHLWRFMNGVDFAMQLGMMPAPGTAPQQPKMEEPAKK